MQARGNLISPPDMRQDFAEAVVAKAQNGDRNHEIS
jgi:hypothetical protein